MIPVKINIRSRYVHNVELVPWWPHVQRVYEYLSPPSLLGVGWSRVYLAAGGIRWHGVPVAM